MNILIADKMEEPVVAEIKKMGSVAYQPADLNAALAVCEVLIVRSATKVTADMVSKAPKLKLVIRGGVGLDTIDVKACEAKGIRVTNNSVGVEQCGRGARNRL